MLNIDLVEWQYFAINLLENGPKTLVVIFQTGP